MGCSNAASTTVNVPSYTVPTPAQPSGLNVSWQTPTNASSCNGTLSWGAVSGATSYTVNGTNVGNVTSYPVTGTPGQSATFNVAACN
jgi:hypothetical protein